MPNQTPHFDERGRLIAPKYDDVYFSAEDGLAETHYVFLEGNRLATRFAELSPGETFTIGETGFGTGLNFLAVWQLFEQHAPADARLEFVTVEGFPLDHATMQKALSPWPELEPYRTALLEQWGPIWPGTHRFRFADGRVRLTVLVGEAAQVLASADAAVDAWFLDGFAPSRNPGMWSEAVFKEAARLSAQDATLATYTAAGFVRRGLQAVGFDVEKQPGFGTKRDMTVGRYVDTKEPILAVGCKPTRATNSAAIVIGASLAGSFVARALVERGVSVTVLEAQQRVDGELPALSPRVAVLQPKINNRDDPAGSWLREGYAIVERWLRSDQAFAGRAGWHPCGTFQAAHDDRSERRLRRFVQQFEETGLCRWIDANETEQVVGLTLPCGGVFVERAGLLRPAGLCAALLDHPNITPQYNTKANSLQRDGQHWTVRIDGAQDLQTQAVVVANAMSAKDFEQTQPLELRPVRGQVSLLDRSLGSAEQADQLTALRCALFYGGYALPSIGGTQTLGASFIPGDTDTRWRDSEHDAVCDKLARILPDAAEALRAIQSPAGWVGLRTTTPTHRCCAEEIEPGLYISLGHGSHGIASAARAGELVAQSAFAS